MTYHLSQEARAGLTEFRIPREFEDKLFEFQTAAVKIAAHHLNRRGGVLINIIYAKSSNFGRNLQMPYRNKTYVCFDADNDIHYYRLMLAWKQNDNTNFQFHNAHDLNRLLPISNENTIKLKLKERLRNTKAFIVLIGESTQYLYKFVRWEMEQAIDLNIPIVAVNLNGRRQMDKNRCPPIIRDQLVVHISFNLRIVQYALENWTTEYYDLKQEGESGARYYRREVYQQLGL